MGRRSLYSIGEFCRRNPGFSEKQLRWIRFRSESYYRTLGGKEVSLDPNGYRDAFVKIAGRVYVDEDRFFQIVDEQNAKVAA